MSSQRRGRATDFTTNDPDGPLADPPPPYESVVTSPTISRPARRPRTVSQQHLGECNRRPRPRPSAHPSRVSMLHWSHPTPDTQYLSNAERPPPVTVCVCFECREVPPEQTLPKGLMSRLKAYLTGVRTHTNILVEMTEYHSISNGGTIPHVVAIQPGIRKNEVERTVREGNDWTKHWEWTLLVRHWDPDARCQVDGTFYFNDLSGCIRDGVPWQDERKTQPHPSENSHDWEIGEARDGTSEWRLKHTWAFSENARYPRWCGKVTMSRETEGEAVVDPWALFTAPTTQM
ncbi:hypothetical protein IMZ48_14070 [Candidatus Bathyarchaeota archaeon]|nr:hypothetical protein [Candidatus Bathyarchaeota archaeon]